MSDWKEKYDRMDYAIVLTIILPVFGFFLCWLMLYSDATFGQFWDIFVKYKEFRKEIMIFSLLPGMLLFYFLFFQWKMDRAAKGVVIVSIFLGILSLAFGGFFE